MRNLSGLFSPSATARCAVSRMRRTASAGWMLIVPPPTPRCTGTVNTFGLMRLACSHTPASPVTIRSGTSTMPSTKALISISLAWMPLMRTETFCRFIVCASGLASVLEEL